MVTAMSELSWQQWVLIYFVLMALFIKWWASLKPARDAQEFEAGQAYAWIVLERHGDNRETRERLWQEYEQGQTFDPGPFEKGMRQVLDSLAPLEG